MHENKEICQRPIFQAWVSLTSLKISKTRIHSLKVLTEGSISNPDTGMDFVLFWIVILWPDRLVGLVVSMSDYWSWGRGFDPWHFHKF